MVLRRSRLIYKMLKELYWICGFLLLISPAIIEGAYIFHSYIDANMRVFEDSGRAGYQRAEVFFNPDINRFRVFFHVGGGWGYVFIPWLFMLRFLSPFIIFASVFVITGQTAKFVWKWRRRRLEKERRIQVPYITYIGRIQESLFRLLGFFM